MGDFLKGYLMIHILDAIYRSVEADHFTTITMNASFLHHSSLLEIALEPELVEFLSSDRIDRMYNVLSSKSSLMKPKLSEDAFATRSTSYNSVHHLLKSNAYDFYFAPLGFYTIKTVLFLIYLGIFTGLSIHGGIFNDEITFVDYFVWLCMFGFIFNKVFQLGELGVKGRFEVCENYLDCALSFLFLSVMLIRIAGNFYSNAKNAESFALYTKKNVNINALNHAGIIFALISSSYGKYNNTKSTRHLKRNNTFDGEFNETLARQWRCHNPKSLLNNYSIIANTPKTQKIFQCFVVNMYSKNSKEDFHANRVLVVVLVYGRSRRILMSILGCFVIIIIKKCEVSNGSWLATFDLVYVFSIYSNWLVYLLTQHEYAEAEGVDVIISLFLFCNMFAVIDLLTPTYSPIMFSRYSIGIFDGSGV